MFAESSVLMIDSPSDPQTALAVSLRPCYRVTTVNTARAALDSLRSGKFDMIIMELSLLDLDGLCLLSILNRIYPRLPVLILTRVTSVNSMIKALSMGVRGYLQKPCDAGMVLFCVGEILKQQHEVELRQALARAGRSRPARRRRQLFKPIDEWD